MTLPHARRVLSLVLCLCAMLLPASLAAGGTAPPVLVRSTVLGVTAPPICEVGIWQESHDPLPKQSISVHFIAWCLHSEQGDLRCIETVDGYCYVDDCPERYEHVTGFFVGPGQSVRSLPGVVLHFVVIFPDGTSQSGLWSGPSDANMDGVRNSQDLFDFIGSWSTGDPDGGGDFNVDGAVDSIDLFDFVTAFFDV